MTEYIPLSRAERGLSSIDQEAGRVNLPQRDDLYRQLFENMAEAFALFEILTSDSGEPVDFRFVDMNSVYEKLSSRERIGCIGKTMREVIQETDLEEVATYCEVAAKSGAADFEYYARSLGRHLRIRAFRPQPGYLATIIYDITEQRRAEEALRIQRDFNYALSAVNDLDDAFALILDAALSVKSIDSGGVYLADTKGALDLVIHRGLSPEFVNTALHYASDSPQAILVRKGVARYGTHVDLRRELDVVIAREGLLAIAVIPVMHQGELLAVMNLSSRTYDNIPLETRTALETLATYMGGTLLRLRTEAALHASEERYRLLADGLPLAATVTDAETGRVLYANPRAVQMFEAELRGLIGATARDCYVDPLEQDRFVDHLRKHGAAYDYEVQLHTMSGRTFWASLSTNISIYDGRPALHTVLMDVTERRLLQEELRLLNEQLEHRVSERTVQLEMAIAELRRADELKNAFLASVSHELRTPLSGVLGMSDALAMQLSGPLTARQLHYVHEIRSNGDRLLRMVDSILHYAALLADRVEIKQEQCRLSEIAESALRSVQPRAETNHQRLSFKIDPHDLSIVSDSQGIRQVLMHLLDNAVKFTPMGGAIGLEIHGDLDQEVVQLVVWDTGIGIAQEQLALIFNLFEQVDRGLNRQFEGVGLGLAYVREMVKRLGGAVRVESVLQQGSRFTFTLPISPA